MTSGASALPGAAAISASASAILRIVSQWASKSFVAASGSLADPPADGSASDYVAGGAITTLSRPSSFA